MAEKGDWISALNLDEKIPQEVKVCGDRINNSGVWWQAFEGKRMMPRREEVLYARK